MPIINSSKNGGYSPLVSPLTCEPATTSPQIGLTNFNVRVAGSSIYQENFNYEWQDFLQEMRPANGIDGNLMTGLSCGLLSQRDWMNCYRYYVVDLSRRLPEEENLGKSLELLCTINCKNSVNVDLLCFVEYERSFDLDISTGETSL